MKIFNNIPEDEIDILLDDLKTKKIKFKKNSLIISNALNSNILSIIISGKACIERIDYYGNKTIIETLNPGDVFESRMFNLKNNELSIISLQETEVYLIEFDNIMINVQSNNHKQFIDNLLNTMIFYLNRSYEKIEIITKKTIRDKLLAYFTIISNKRLSKSFTIPYNFTQLSNYLAVDRSALMREIKHLKEEGFIKIENKKITLNIEL